MTVNLIFIILAAQWFQYQDVLKLYLILCRQFTSCHVREFLTP